MRAWFADADGRLREARDVSSVGRAVDGFVVWDAGRRVLTAPRLLRATAFDGCTVELRLREDRLPAVRDRYGDCSTLRFDGARLTVDEVTAVEAVHRSYPPAFERLFHDADHDLCLRVRGEGDLFLDAELVAVTA